MVMESISHPPSYAEAKKMTLLTLHTQGHFRGLFFISLLFMTGISRPAIWIGGMRHICTSSVSRVVRVSLAGLSLQSLGHTLGPRHKLRYYSFDLRAFNKRTYCKGKVNMLLLSCTLLLNYYNSLQPLLLCFSSGNSWYGCNRGQRCGDRSANTQRNVPHSWSDVQRTAVPTHADPQQHKPKFCPLHHSEPREKGRQCSFALYFELHFELIFLGLLFLKAWAVHRFCCFITGGICNCVLELVGAVSRKGFLCLNCNCKYDDLYSIVSSKLLLGCFTRLLNKKSKSKV